MTDARLRSRTQRVAVALALAVAMVLGGWALGLPSASADPAVTVYIRDLTPPAVSVDANGTVTFINQIADKPVSVGVGPLAVTAVVHTDVTVNLPSGSHVVKPSAAAPAGQPQPTAKDLPPYSQTQQAWTETFPQSCVTCSISYAYRVDGAQLSQVLGLLPPLPAVPTPFVVNTILPLPNLPGANVPNLPKIDINLPGQLPGVPNGTTLPGQGSLTTTTTTTTTTRQPLNAPIAQYSKNGVEMAPSGGGAVPAFDPSRGSSGGPASDPAIGNPGLANRSATGPASSGPFSPAALLALVSVAGVATWLARSILARLVAD